ncbi:MAG TPA: GDSL-type esterase/lipase family protein [Mycobacteriales bacterium]|nr:GDSL-type esterase/lipase family protein [Mycobacteriales bacterium]
MPARPRPVLAVVVVSVAAVVVTLVGWRGTAVLPRAVAAAACGPTWVTAWQAAMQPGPAPRAVAGGGTLRMVVRPQVEGAQIRVRLSNVYGSAPLAVDAVSAGRAGGGPGDGSEQERAVVAGVSGDGGAAAGGGAGVAVAGSGSGGASPVGAGGAGAAAGNGSGGAGAAAGEPGSEQPVTFGGRAATVIPPGAEAVSDPVPVAVAGPLAVTIAVPALPDVVSEHPVALQTSWLAPRGGALGTPTTSWLLLSGLDVLAPRPVHAVVAVGDSITDGVGTAPDADARWTDALAARLTAAGGDATMTVLNAGISRNELLADGVGGPPPQARFARDVADALGATDVVLNIGTNDIAEGRDAAAIEAGLVRFADAAQAAGKRVFLTTITPSTAGAHGSPQAVATRNAVNTWIRTQGHAHAAGVVDFAAAVADPAHPDRLAPVADAGDGLHLSAAGYRALAAAVPMAALSGSPCLAEDPATLALSATS